MDKQHIIDEIRRTALDGKAVGQKRFETETGIKVHYWRGKYWANWGDAVKEAGFAPNDWTTAYDESHILQRLLYLTRKLGHFPTKSQMGLERQADAKFPHSKAIYRIGSKNDLVIQLLAYCDSRPEYSDLVLILQKAKVDSRPEEVPDEVETSSSGYVYLVCAQNAYKIGCTRAPYRRAAEIANQSANGATLEHLIPTDDPAGIEKYWHARFADTRIIGTNKQSGEWFKLSKEDIRAFKRRKNFM